MYALWPLSVSRPHLSKNTIFILYLTLTTRSVRYVSRHVGQPACVARQPPQDWGPPQCKYYGSVKQNDSSALSRRRILILTTWHILNEINFQNDTHHNNVAPHGVY